MGIGVLLNVEEGVANDGLKLRHPSFDCLADDEQRGRGLEAVVERAGLLEKAWSDVPLATPLMS